MQVADYFPKRRSTVITFFSGAFSASPVVLVLLKYAYDHLQMSYFNVTLSLFVVSLTMFPVTFWLLPKDSVRKQEQRLLDRWQKYRGVVSQLSHNSAMEDSMYGDLKRMKPRHIDKTLLADILQDCANQKSVLLTTNTEMNGDTTTLPIEQKAVIVSSSQRRPVKRQSPLHRLWKVFSIKPTSDEMPLRVSLFSLSFLAHQLWFSWLNTYIVLYSGSMILWLGRVSDDEQATRSFTQAFGLVQVLALVFAPMAGYIMDQSVANAIKEPNLNKRRLLMAKSGFIPILITTITLACAGVCRFFDTSIAVYTSIFFITLVRSFLIAVASAYIRVRYQTQINT